jgi:hypothetical protein
MAHWRKRNPSAAHFNAYVARLGFAFSIMLAALFLLSIHGHAYTTG